MARFSSLTIGVNVDSAALQRGLRSSADEIRDFQRRSRRQFRAIANAARVVTTAIVGIGAGVGVLASARSEFQRNIQAISTAAGLTTSEFRQQAFAAQQAGIEVDQLGAIYQDTRERIGDFLATGGGPFQDFIDVMGLTTDQGRALAMQLEGLSGPDVLERLVSEMESAGVSAEQMSFAMEGLASDATRLIPLLTNGAAGSRELQEAFAAIRTPFTQEDRNVLRDVDVSLGLLGTATGDLADQFLVALGPAIIAVTGAITDLLTDITRLIDSGFSALTNAIDEYSNAITIAAIVATPLLIASVGSLAIALGTTLVTALMAARIALTAFVVSNPLLIAITAIVAGVVALGALFINFRDEVATVFGALASVLSAPFIAVFRLIQRGFADVLNGAARIADFVGLDGLAMMIAGLSNNLDFEGTIREQISADVQGVGAGASNLSAGFSDALSGAFDGVMMALGFNTQAVVTNTEATDTNTTATETGGAIPSPAQRRGGTASDPATMAAQSLTEDIANAISRGNFDELGNVFVNNIQGALTDSLSMNLQMGLSDLLGGFFMSVFSSIFAGGGGGIGSIFGSLFGGFFQQGGIVPGRGPVPIVAHGGEVVLNREQQMALLRGGTGGSTVQNFNITGDVTAATRRALRDDAIAIARQTTLQQREEGVF